MYRVEINDWVNIWQSITTMERTPSFGKSGKHGWDDYLNKQKEKPWMLQEEQWGTGQHTDLHR